MLSKICQEQVFESATKSSKDILVIRGGINVIFFFFFNVLGSRIRLIVSVLIARQNKVDCFPTARQNRLDCLFCTGRQNKVNCFWASNQNKVNCFCAAR